MTTDTTTNTSTTITAMADGCEAAISDQGATIPDWEEIAKWHLEGIREQAEALEAQIERLQRALVREVNRNRMLRGYIPLRDAEIVRYCRLQPGDLPPSEGSETP